MDNTRYYFRKTFLPIFRFYLKYKNQCFHGSWHTVPNTKYVCWVTSAENFNMNIWLHILDLESLRSHGCFIHKVFLQPCIMSGTDGTLINIDWKTGMNELLMAISWGNFVRFYNFMTINVHTFCHFFFYLLIIKKWNLNIHQKALLKSQGETLYSRSSNQVNIQEHF